MSIVAVSGALGLLLTSRKLLHELAPSANSPSAVLLRSRMKLS
jgi:hypothetical protein